MLGILHNVLKQGVFQQIIKVAYTTQQCIKMVYVGNVILYGFDLDVRVVKLRHSWVSGKNWVYESVNVLGGAIRTDFVPQ